MSTNLSIEWIRTTIILPINVLVIIPAILLFLTGYRWTPNFVVLNFIGVILFMFGLFFAGWTMRLFATKGQGTAAPWNPPKKLVVAGPYCHVRNPMITSVLSMQIAEVLLLNSWFVLGLFILFFIGNIIYFPLFEERDLENRFGESYREYKRNVPRWIPRFTAWKNESV